MQRVEGCHFQTLIVAICCTIVLVFFIDSSGKEIMVPVSPVPKIAQLNGFKADSKEVKRANDKNIKRPCGYTKFFPGGYGAKIHDMVYAWSWSLQNNVTYKGAIGSGNIRTLNELIKLLKLPFSGQSRPFQNCSLLSNFKAERWLHINPFFKQKVSKPVKTKRNIVVHVRRGDVSVNYPQTGDYNRYIPNAYFLDLIDKIRKPNDKVTIFSQRTEPFDDFINAGYDVKLDTSVVVAWKAFIEADIFIMSRSSFSYIPALFNSGIVYYSEYWSKPLSHWLTETTCWPEVKRTNTISMTEQVLPCEGGQFGAKTIQMHVCVISKTTTIMFFHLPHIAQTLFPCWSWFAEKKAKNCVFLVKGRLSYPWFNFIAAKMGCFITSRRPRRCTVLGTLNTRLTVKPGETYSWLSSPSDAERLRQIIFRQKIQSKGIGIINRKKNRRILHIDKFNLKADVVYFEDVSYFIQSRWMYEHDIIIAAHGASMANTIFIRKCTVVIQLYPEHYYPNKFFEVLIKQSGGIPISWTKNKYLGDNATLDAANDDMLLEDFKQHDPQRGQYKVKDINIDKSILYKLLEIAKYKQNKCLGAI